jgi:hypothetical protein
MASVAIPSGSNPIIPRPLESFKKLSARVYFHEAIPESNKAANGVISTRSRSQRTSNEAPNVIILFTWMGAAPKHIAKYTSTYTKLYPHTPIILIRTQLFDIMSLPTSILRRRYAPAFQKLFSISSQSSETPRVLAQTFSNGGAFALLNFARFYRALNGQPPPISALILDSGPAIGNIKRSVAAIMAPVCQNPLVWYPVFFGITFLLRLLFWKDRLLGRKSIVRRTYLGMNEKGVLPEGVPRLYIYSLADSMVDWKEVEAHARVAEEDEGISGSGKVELCRFEGSEHVAHLREDAGKYWDAVQRRWEGRKKV